MHIQTILNKLSGLFLKDTKVGGRHAGRKKGSRGSGEGAERGRKGHSDQNTLIHI